MRWLSINIPVCRMTRSYVESELGTDPLPDANLLSDDIPVCASNGEKRRMSWGVRMQRRMVIKFNGIVEYNKTECMRVQLEKRYEVIVNEDTESFPYLIIHPRHGHNHQMGQNHQ